MPDESSIVLILDTALYDKLLEELDAPPREVPRLREFLERLTVWSD